MAASGILCSLYLFLEFPSGMINQCVPQARLPDLLGPALIPLAGMSYYTGTHHGSSPCRSGTG
jgi:hypothetical protein